MIIDPVNLAGFTLQSIEQIAHFCNHVRKVANFPEDVLNTLHELEVESVELAKISREIRRVLFEAQVTSGAVVHPNLESTLRRTDRGLIAAFNLLIRWASRTGLGREWEACLKGEKHSDTTANCKSAKKWRALLNPKPHVIWGKICLAVYGFDDIKQTLEDLRRHHHDLYILSSMLPFSFSEKLRGMEDNLLEVWRHVRDADVIQDPRLPDRQHKPKYSLLTELSPEDKGDRRVFVLRDKDMSATVLGNLKWTVKMLGSLNDEDQCKKVGLLQCEGYFRQHTGNYYSNGQYGLSFKLPIAQSSANPCTLREWMLEMPTPSLSDRVRISQTLVTSIVVLHTFGIVHRFLNAESIIVFPHADDIHRLGDLYLLGFSQSRPEKGGSRNQVEVATDEEDKLRAQMYTHFDILSDPRRVKYTTKHDIFSLGVCLLEIALWKSIVVMNKDAVQKLKGIEVHEQKEVEDTLIFDKGGDYAFLDTNSIAEVLKEELDERVRLTGDTKGGLETERIAQKRRELLVAHARREIPPVLGHAFCDVVVACLQVDLELPSPSLVKSDRTPSSATPSSNAPPGVVPSQSSAKAAPWKCDSEKEICTTSLLSDLLENRKMSGDTVHTIIVARKILQKLEQINI